MSTDKIISVTSFTGCSEAQAAEVLAKYDGDVERAINSALDDPGQFDRKYMTPSTVNSLAPWTGPAPDPSVEWSKPPSAPPSSEQTAPHQQTVSFQPQWGENNSNAIDLTGSGDDDDELKRAMVASLEDSQQRKQYYPPGNSMVGPLQEQGQAGLSEDEQLRQALEASVQSQQGGLSQEASGSRLPVLSPHLEIGEHTKRKDGAPVTLVAPFSPLDMVAAMLQAVAALTPARHAFLAFQPADSRASELLNYWKGISPPEAEPQPLNAVDPSRRAGVDFCRRAQTLFAFMNESERAACIVRDVSSLTPAHIVALGAEMAEPARIAAQYYDFLVHCFLDAAPVHAVTVIPGQEGENMDHPRRNLVNERARIFQTWGATALTRPPTPRDGQDADYVPPPLGIPQARTWMGLVHDSVNNDIYSCLRAALATSDGEGALMTDAAQVLCLSIEHRNGELLQPMSIEETLYVDPFMWEKRKGMRLDSELSGGEIGAINATLQDLEGRKRKLKGENGKDAIALLNTSIKYFEELAIATDDEDRTQMQKEAGPQLKEILATLEKDLAETEASITTATAELDGKRTQVREAAKEEALKPEWRTMPYHLQAVLVHETHRVFAYVKQPDGKWWRVCDGSAAEVTAEEVTSDKMRDGSSCGVFWVCYTKQPEEGPTPDEPCPEETRAAIGEDNLTLQSELLSLIRSDAATPATSEDHAMQQDTPANHEVDAAAEDMEETQLADPEAEPKTPPLSPVH